MARTPEVSQTARSAGKPSIVAVVGVTGTSHLVVLLVMSWIVGVAWHPAPVELMVVTSVSSLCCRTKVPVDAQSAKPEPPTGAVANSMLPLAGS